MGASFGRKQIQSVLVILLVAVIMVGTVGCGASGVGGDTVQTVPEQTAGTSAPSVPVSEDIPQPDPALHFQNSISREVLCRYLSRAVTLSLEGSYVPTANNSRHVKQFILNTGAKYICRAATCWEPDRMDYETYEGQRAFLQSVHRQDPDVVFEACVFECVSPAVEGIAIPDWVFRAFGLEPEDRNFSYEAMCFPDGSHKNAWGEGCSVPDITRQETMLFIYYRACGYIDLGYEAIHLGQVHLMGRNDRNWAHWTQVLSAIRQYALQHARRGFVFLNAHTHGIIGSDGTLLFDFHMYPSRPMADGSQSAHLPTEADPQRAVFSPNHYDSIYGKSMGGKTYSGWSCDSLPYLVELDNYGDATDRLNVPAPQDMWVWGMDEITWFANQSRSYRAEFLRYAYDWVMNTAPGDGYFAMPGQRVARIYDSSGAIVGKMYQAYDSSYYPGGSCDEQAIRSIWGS